MSKVSEGNFFEHFTLYQEFVHATPRTIGEGEVALYIALTGARQPLPSAAPIAKTLGYLSRPVMICWRFTSLLAIRWRIFP